MLVVTAAVIVGLLAAFTIVISISVCYFSCIFILYIFLYIFHAELWMSSCIFFYCCFKKKKYVIPVEMQSPALGLLLYFLAL